MTSKSSELFRRRVNMQSVNMRKQRRVATRSLHRLLCSDLKATNLPHMHALSPLHFHRLSIRPRHFMLQPVQIA